VAIVLFLPIIAAAPPAMSSQMMSQMLSLYIRS